MMKIFFPLFFFFSSYSFSQGKYSYEFSTLIQKKFVTEKDLPELKGFRYEQGQVLGEINPNTPYFSSLEVFRKGNIAIVILDKMTNPETKTKSVIEVLKISKILKNQEIRISGCSRKNPYPDEEIVALVTTNSSKVNVLRAFALIDIRFEKLNHKKVKCVNEID